MLYSTVQLLCWNQVQISITFFKRKVMPFQNLNRFVWWGRKYYMQEKYAIMPILKELSSSRGHKFTPKAEHTTLQMLGVIKGSTSSPGTIYCENASDKMVY